MDERRNDCSLDTSQESEQLWGTQEISLHFSHFCYLFTLHNHINTPALARNFSQHKNSLKKKLLLSGAP